MLKRFSTALLLMAALSTLLPVFARADVIDGPIIPLRGDNTVLIVVILVVVVVIAAAVLVRFFWKRKNK